MRKQVGKGYLVVFAPSSQGRRHVGGGRGGFESSLGARQKNFEMKVVQATGVGRKLEYAFYIAVVAVGIWTALSFGKSVLSTGWTTYAIHPLKMTCDRCDVLRPARNAEYTWHALTQPTDRLATAAPPSGSVLDPC